MPIFPERIKSYIESPLIDTPLQKFDIYKDRRTMKNALYYTRLVRKSLLCYRYLQESERLRGVVNQFVLTLNH